MPTAQQQEPSTGANRLRTANLGVVGATEAASILGVSRTQVHRLVWSGVLAADDIAVPVAGRRPRPLFVFATRDVHALRVERETAARKRAEAAQRGRDAVAHARPGGQP